MNLESRGPNQHIVQYTGQDGEVLMYGTDVESCESAVGIVCQGKSHIPRK